jgi:peptide/nickel transport system permease protein
MIRTTLTRLAIFLPSLLVASFVIFGLTQLIPGGAAESLAGPDATPSVLEAIRHRIGTDRPLIVQYWSWLTGVLHGDFGTSYQSDGEVSTILAARAPVTFELAGWALLVAVLVGGALGVLAARWQGRMPDRAVLGVTGLSLALPEFWLAMLALGLFAVTLGVVPASGEVPWSDGALPHLRSIVMPVLLLALGPAAIIARITRSAMTEVMLSTYVRTAWAAGIRARDIYLKFALKNIAVSVITVIGLVTGTLLGGAVLIEQVFTIPGMGSMLLNAALSKDVPVMQAAVLLIVVLVLFVNLLVDASYTLLDPRIRRSRA